jgi:hypothetical protein
MPLFPIVTLLRYHETDSSTLEVVENFVESRLIAEDGDPGVKIYLETRLIDQAAIQIFDFLNLKSYFNITLNGVIYTVDKESYLKEEEALPFSFFSKKKTCQKRAVQLIYNRRGLDIERTKLDAAKSYIDTVGLFHHIRASSVDAFHSSFLESPKACATLMFPSLDEDLKMHHQSLFKEMASCLKSNIHHIFKMAAQVDLLKFEPNVTYFAYQQKYEEECHADYSMIAKIMILWKSSDTFYQLTCGQNDQASNLNVLPSEIIHLILLKFTDLPLNVTTSIV